MPKCADPLLSSEQEAILGMAVQGHSLLFTGGAGTGKSVLARAIVKALRTKHGAARVGVTATTGIAAVHIGGQTLHSWTGVGLGNGTVRDLVAVVMRGRERREKWRAARVLVVDEVSMLDAVMFDKLEAVAREVRKSSLPFGGIQLVFVGDFYQLPPVVTAVTRWASDEAETQMRKSEHEHQVALYPSRFVFHAFKWKECVPTTIVLKTVFRQSDQQFISMLEELRRDRLSPETVRAFRALSRPLKTDDGIVPTELYPTRNEVSSSNEARLRALSTHREVYTAADRSRVHPRPPGGGVNPAVHAWLDKSTMFPLHLELRERAQVMLLKNCNGDLVNGSRGIVVGFVLFRKDPRLIKRHEGQVYYPRHLSPPTPCTPGSQDPHAGLKMPRIGTEMEPPVKNESLDEFDDPLLDAALEMVQVNLPDAGRRRGELGRQRTRPASQARVLQGLPSKQVAGIGPDALSRYFVEVAVAATGSAIVTGLEHGRDNTYYPVVRFVSGREYLVVPMEHRVEDHVGREEGARVQVPLMLAWSMSIHKAQGMTLDKVSINLARAFERGQVYVALSRATQLATLQVQGFSPEKVRVDPLVLAWEKQVLETQSDLRKRPPVPALRITQAKVRTAGTRARRTTAEASDNKPRQTIESMFALSRRRA